VYPLLTQLTVRQLARPLMLELARYARGSVALGLRDDVDIVVVETVVENPANERSARHRHREADRPHGVRPSVPGGCIARRARIHSEKPPEGLAN